MGFPIIRANTDSRFPIMCANTDSELSLDGAHYRHGDSAPSAGAVVLAAVLLSLVPPEAGVYAEGWSAVPLLGLQLVTGAAAVVLLSLPRHSADGGWVVGATAWIGMNGSDRKAFLLAEGHSNEAIAYQVHVSERTVESHVSAISVPSAWLRTRRSTVTSEEA